MGCDIHLTAEYRRDGVWVNDDLEVSPDYYASGETGINNKGSYKDQLYNGRNYDLFGMLADVRNGYGFAGTDTGEGFKPIAAPKGIPEDATTLYKEWVNQWSGDGHSHSWLTVAELLAYDWTQTTIKRGVVGYREYARWRIDGAPEAWSGGVSGPGIRHHAGDAAAPIIDRIIGGKWWDLYHGFEGDLASESQPATNERNRLPAETYDALAREFGTRPVFVISWSSSYYHSASEFLSEVMPRLWRMGAPKDVRICFFFDN